MKHIGSETDQSPNLVLQLFDKHPLTNLIESVAVIQIMITSYSFCTVTLDGKDLSLLLEGTLTPPLYVCICIYQEISTNTLRLMSD